MPQPKVILVVDDEAKVVDVVRSYLERAGYAVMSASSGSAALSLFACHTPALVVLDLMLPDVSGEEVCRSIREKSTTPVIMLTAKSAEQSILNGLQIGADDYVVKPFSPRQLVARVEAVLRRSTADSTTAGPVRLDHGRLIVDDAHHEVWKDGNPIALTPSEYKLLLTLARHPGRVYTRDELITGALGEEYEGYDRAVDTHVKNIRQKLEDNPRSPRWILTIHGVGYKFGGGDEDQSQG